MTATATWKINEQFNGINIFFDSIPDVKIRTKMKEHGFKWHNRDKYWFAKNNPTRLKFVKNLCKVSATQETKPEKVETEEPKPKIESQNKFGVQVGDIFESSWGYDETHVTFLQVVKLCGKESVRVREVTPKILERNAESAMSETTKYLIDREILPAHETSVFIKDQEKGDLKRIKSYAADGVSNPQITLDSFANAYLVAVGEKEAFTSWWR